MTEAVTSTPAELQGGIEALQSITLTILQGMSPEQAQSILNHAQRHLVTLDMNTAKDHPDIAEYNKGAQAVFDWIHSGIPPR